MRPEARQRSDARIGCQVDTMNGSRVKIRQVGKATYGPREGLNPPR
jgi:hypothetical protein